MLSILFAFIGLVIVCASAEFMRHSRWIDRLALVGFVVLSVGTRPSARDHDIEVARSIESSHRSPAVAANVTARLEHHDHLVLSSTRLDGKIASVGVFGRVFVLADQ